MKATKDELAAAVAARIEFLKEVAAFAEMITRERGETLKNEVHKYHVRSVRELFNFGGFSFRVDVGQSEWGGNDVKIWYHPGSRYADIAKTDSSQAVALDISWGIEIEKPTHMRFNDNPGWQREILKVIRRWKSIAAQVDRAAIRTAAKNAARVEKERRDSAITEQARRLQIT